MKASTAELIEYERDLDAEIEYRARRGILAFTKYTYPEYQIAWHHRILARELDAWLRGEFKYLMVFMPPRHGKSELVSRRLPAFIHGLYPNSEIMAASYLDSLAGDMCVDVQKIMDSPQYAKLFPNTRIPKPRSMYTKGVRNASEHTILDRDGNPYAKGKYRGQGVGGSFTGKGANFIIVDDPIKGREIADSVAFREKLWNFWTNDLYSRLETDLKSGREGQVLITQTRWHEDDLSGRLIAQMKKDPKAMQWKIVHLPAIRVDLDNPQDPRPIGEALWPQKYNLDQLEEIKAGTTPRGWTAVYQQNPVPADGNLFTDRMFQIVEKPTRFDWMFVTADTAYKEKQHNDFTVFSLWGVLNNELYLVDCWRKQIQAANVEEVIGAWLKPQIKYGYRATLIEPKGHGIYLNQKWQTKGFMIPNEDDLKKFYDDRHIDKAQRANNVVPHLAHRVVYVCKGVRDKEDLIAEALGFPNALHDDFTDTLIDALKRLYGKFVGILDVL